VPRKINLPHFTGQVPYEVEQAIQRLREELESAFDRQDAIAGRIDALPPQLTLEQIQQELSPSGNYPLPTAGLLGTTPAPSVPGDTTPPDPINDGIPDHLDIVESVRVSMGIGPTSTDEEMWRFLQTVVEEINNSGTDPVGLVCGYTLAPPAGAAVFTCAGITYRYARVCYSNGHLFDIVIDADPGGTRLASWQDNGLDLSLYSVATSPTSPC
jgi:hypothetical protein